MGNNTPDTKATNSVYNFQRYILKAIIHLIDNYSRVPSAKYINDTINLIVIKFTSVHAVIIKNRPK